MSSLKEDTPFGPSALLLRSRYFRRRPFKQSTNTSQVSCASSKDRPEIVSARSSSSNLAACERASTHHRQTELLTSHNARRIRLVRLRSKHNSFERRGIGDDGVGNDLRFLESEHLTFTGDVVHFHGRVCKEKRGVNE